jgi:hypothetical protein
MKTSPLYLGIDFGTTNSSVAYVYADPRHLQAQNIPVKPVRIVMDAENSLMAERMPSLVSTRFDDHRSNGLAGGWDVLRIFGRRKKAPLLRRGHELFESVKSDLGSSRIYAHASSPACQTPRKVAGAIFRALLRESIKQLPGLEPARVRVVITVPASLNAEARRELTMLGAAFKADPLQPIRAYFSKYVIVGMGSYMETCEVAVDYLRKTRGIKVGCLNVCSFRPFPSRQIIEALQHCKAFSVLERMDDPLSTTGNHLTREIKAAFCDAVTGQNGQTKIDRVPKIYGGAAGLGSRDVRPGDIESLQNEIKARITSQNAVAFKPAEIYRNTRNVAPVTSPQLSYASKDRCSTENDVHPLTDL